MEEHESSTAQQNCRGSEGGRLRAMVIVLLLKSGFLSFNPDYGIRVSHLLLVDLTHGEIHDHSQG